MVFDSVGSGSLPLEKVRRLAPARSGEYVSTDSLEVRAFAEALLLRQRGWTGSGQRCSAKTRDVEVSILSNSTAAVRTRAPKAAPSAFPIRVSDDTISRLTSVFSMLGDPSRLKILLALTEYGEMHVSALCEMLAQGEGGSKFSQPAVSHHLTLMRMVGLVGFRRDGKHNYYHLVSSHMRDLFEQFFAECGNGNKGLQFQDFSLAFKRK